MKRGVNKVTLIGHADRDPEVREISPNQVVSTIILATSRAQEDRQTHECGDQIEWHRVVFFQKLAGIVRDDVKKGSWIHVEGRLHTRKWQDQTGQDRYTTEIIALELHMINYKTGNILQVSGKSRGLNNCSSASIVTIWCVHFPIQRVMQQQL